MSRYLAATAVLHLVLSACTASGPQPATESSALAGEAPTPDADPNPDSDTAVVTDTSTSFIVTPADALDRIEAIQTQVNTWAGTGDLATAKEAAEGAINLVVGENGPYFGDATDNGVVTGGTGPGLLPGLDGEPGLAQADSDNDCVRDDVLGGSWEDAAQRWATLDTAINEWSESNNPFPGLPSHPQRIVGWARLTLQTETIEEAVEFAGHAQLHVDVSRDAYAC